MSSLLDSLAGLAQALDAALTAAQSEPELAQLKVAYFGKKGQLTEILKQVGALAGPEKIQVGKEANLLKTRYLALLDDKLQAVQAQALQALAGKRIDYTLPGRAVPLGHLHPLERVLDTVTELFRKIGFEVCEGPEIETEYYNFEALNIPKTHPARDMQDTFYVDGGRLLRTHTSPVQIHYMNTHEPPFQMIAPGKVYRRDSDISHTPMFHQIEGLVVASGISMGHLKGILELFLKAFFGNEVVMRLRPSYFPFTEPSCEVDISCILCGAKGCPVCKSGWLEVMGAGMVHPQVFRAVGYDPERVTGFAFGMGIERLAMLKYRIGDIRLFYDNHLPFLEQF